jgi:alkylhydroperoxidase family enzyme
MPFRLEGSPVAVRPDLVNALREEWERLSGPGSVWTGRRRVALAAAARRGGVPDDTQSKPTVPAAALQAAAVIYSRPAAITSARVDEYRAAGLDDRAYVETVGVVSRLAAVDGVLAALGIDPEPLPDPIAGTPSGIVAQRARPGRGYVPMVGGTSVVGALSLLPAEAAAQEALHGPLYLTYDDMSDLTYRRGLDRPRMELIASRTSAVNECFY